MVAVEVNEGLVARDRRESTNLRAGDKVELVTIMGGG
jgi:thiamine biosynthesis protein ThiS